MKVVKYLAFVVPIVLMFSPVVTSAAELIVKVTDEGEPVPMAEIFLLDFKTRAMVNNDFTNKSGVYQFTVKQGIYELKVIKDPFSDVTIKDIKVKKSNIKKDVKLVHRAFGPEETAVQSDDDCE